MISIIIPIAKNDDAWQGLIANIKEYIDDKITEVILISEDNINSDYHKARIIQEANLNRAKSLNIAAKYAVSEYLWFLHGDSRFYSDILDKLNNKLRKDQLYYFNLKFYDAIFLMKITSFFVYLRCKISHIAFGDQGFLLSKNLFNDLGGFKEDLLYGEDHIFIWQAKKSRIKIVNIAEKLFTSDRKYRKNGWFKTTIMHQYLWWKQLINKQL